MNMRRRLSVAITLSGLYILASCNDDVTAPPDAAVGSIVLDLEADTLSVRQTTQLHATVLGESGEPLPGVAVTFESGNQDIVIVSETGLVTATGPGRATITARTGDRTASITIHVRRAASISVVPGDTTVVVDDRLKLVATVLDVDGRPIEDPAVSWAVDGSVLFGFNLKGLIAEFRANRVGNGVITATTEGLTYDVNVAVDPSEVGSVLLSPDSLTIERGKSAKLRVVVRDTTGAVIADPQVVFSCGCGTAATVDSTGLVTGVSTGRISTIFARSRGVNSNTVQVRVFLALSEVSSVRLSPDSVTVRVGGTAQLAVTIRDKTGAVAPWLPGEVRFFCGDIFSPPDRCTFADQTFATITNTGIITRVFGRPPRPVPVWAFYQPRPGDGKLKDVLEGVRSNTIWLSTR